MTLTDVCPSMQTNKKALLDELIDAGAVVTTIDDKSPAELAKDLAGVILFLLLCVISGDDGSSRPTARCCELCTPGTL